MLKSSEVIKNSGITIMHPYFWISPEMQWTALNMLVITAFLVMVVMYGIGRSLRVRLGGVPSRVVALDMPWGTQRTEARIRVWKEKGLLKRAFLQTSLRYLWLLCLSPALSLACALLSAGSSGAAAVYGSMLSWGVLLAVPLDVLRNTIMLRKLKGVSRMVVKTDCSVTAKFLAFLLKACCIIYIASAIAA